MFHACSLRFGHCLTISFSITSRCVGANTLQYNWSGFPIPVVNCTGSPPVSFDNFAITHGLVEGLWFFIEPNGTVVMADLDETSLEDIARTKSVRAPFLQVWDITHRFQLLVPFRLSRWYSLRFMEIHMKDPPSSETGPSLTHRSLSLFLTPSDSGFLYIPGINTAWNLLLCNVSVHDVDYRYNPISPSGPAAAEVYNTLSSTDSSATTNKLLAAVVQYFKTPWTGQRTEGTGLQSGNFAEAYALELSRELLAFSASIYEPRPVSRIMNVDNTIVGSRLQVVPMALFLVWVLLYSYVPNIYLPRYDGSFFRHSFVTLGIAVSAAAASRPFVHLAFTSTLR